MSAPKTRAEMLETGYRFEGTGVCRDCGAAIEWFRTIKGYRAPYNAMSSSADLPVSHFATCPSAARFRTRQTAAIKKGKR